MKQSTHLLPYVVSLTVFQLILFPPRNRKVPLLYLTTFAVVFLGVKRYGLQICLNGLSDFVLMLFLIFILSVYSSLYCFNIPLKQYPTEILLPWCSIPCISRKLLQYTPEALDFSIFLVRFHQILQIVHHRFDIFLKVNGSVYIASRKYRFC